MDELSNLLDTKSKWALMYLGTKGGGAKLTEDLIMLFNEMNIEHTVYISSNNKETFSFGKSLEIVKVPNSKLRLFSIYRYLKTLGKIEESILNRRIDKVLIPMTHPWDLRLANRLIAQGVSVSRIVHDDKTHLGDLWPTRRTIRKMHDSSSSILYLSEYVRKNCENLSKEKETFVVKFPKPNIRISTKELAVGSRNKDEANILFIGRNRKYQNFNSIPRIATYVLKQIPQSKKIHFKVICSQKGVRNLARRTLAAISEHPNATLLIEHGWQSQEELERCIRKASVVVFPYIEASQSGTIPICKLLSIPVVVTPVGGLPEQVDDDIDMVSHSIRSEDIASAISALIS